MWGRRKRSGGSRVDTLVGERTLLRGDLEFAGGLHVEGRIVGNVVAAGERGDAILTLSEQGVIEGVIRAPEMVLNGTVNGDVHASGRIELAPKARIHGNVYYRLLEMAGGAEVNGKLVHRDNDADAAADAIAEDGEGEPGRNGDLTGGAPVENNNL